jgi:cytochrome c-type biogenesis protein CcmH
VTFAALALAAALLCGARAASPAADAPVGLAEPPAGPPLEGAALEAEARRVSLGLRCPVCQGLSVADSNADAARAMRARVHELVAQGYSEQQIVDYFVDRYGAFVQLEPEAEGLNLLLFIVPPAVVLAGIGVWIARARGAGPALTPGGGAGSPASDDPYQAAILAEIEGGRS